MTSMKMRDPKTDELLTPHNAVLIIIDVQPVQVGSLATMEKRAFVQNVKSLAEIAKLYNLPTILSTVNVQTGLNKPMIHQVTDVLSDVPVYDRTTLNAWEDSEFLAAVKATGRKKLVISALWTEVCLAFPTLDALRDGFDVYPVVDACGSTSEAAHRAGLERMVQAGAKPVSWVSLICELQRDWGRVETKADFARILFAVEGN